MAKEKIPIRDLTLWESSLEFFPVDYKNATWISQYLFFHKNNSAQFLEPKRYATYMALERLHINTQEYINMVDPPTPMGGGGTAEYFAADFKEIPISQHLDNILRAKLDRIGDENQLQVNEIDKYAKGQRQREKDRILYQQEFRSLINEVNKDLNLPPIKDSESPYNYVRSLSGNSDSSDVTENLIDYIRAQVNDSQDMALFMSYVYKGDIEKAFELGIQHYLINLNKWSVKCQFFNMDLKNFNKCCGQIYTDALSGRQTLDYINPTILYTNPFASMNGEDITRWNFEKNISFADFVRRFGMTLTNEQLQAVFELNKNQGGSHGMSWNQASGVRGAEANIRIGFMSCLTQDAEKFSEEYASGKIPAWQRKPLSWLPSKHTPTKYKSDLKQKIYNVWYSCYYIPPPSSRLSRNSQTDWAWQSQFIFDLRKDIDMYRFGVDLRYAKSTLVLWQDPRPSFTDIKEAYMPKIRTAWHNFQNCLINNIDAVGLSDDFIGAILNSADEADKISLEMPNKPVGGNGQDPKLTAMRMLKQGGMAFLKMTDRQGKPLVDPSKFVVPVKNGMMEKAEQYLNIILQLYNLMTMSLAQNNLSEGQDPEPRTAVAGIQASLAAAEQGIWFVEKGSREFLVQCGERTIQWMLYIIKEHKRYKLDERWSELQSVLGLGNAMALESVEDYNPEEIGLTVTLEDVRAKKQFYSELAVQMLRDGKIEESDLELITSTIESNYKYGSTLLTIAAKKAKKEAADKMELEQQYIMQQKEADLKIAQALKQQDVQGKNENIMTEGKVKAMINDLLNKGKHASQAALMEQRGANKEKEAVLKTQLDVTKKQEEKNIDNQQPIEQ